jgi:ribosomal protein S27AE
MTKADKMTCQECGVEMNHHALKIDYTAALDGSSEIDPQLGGVLEEAHTCPLCGKTEMRRAAVTTQSE